MLRIAAPGGVQKRLYLLIVKRVYFLLLQLGQFAPGGGVLRYVLQIDGLFQCHVQHLIGQTDRGRGKAHTVYKLLYHVGAEIG